MAICRLLEGSRLAALVAGMLLAGAVDAAALTIHNHYSPKNAVRSKRAQTEFIILHTTEGGTAGALDKIQANGEAHYLIEPGGIVYRIVHRSRIAFHAGRSMWNGQRNLDLTSVGIEIVGYHDRAISRAQYSAARELIADLQKIYRIPDECVLTHSMVAYGAPNRWQSRSHRGRKRCAMLLAGDAARRQLGLDRKQREDPDVKAGRLAVGDPYLAKVLYAGAPAAVAVTPGPVGGESNVIRPGRSAWDIARDRYRSAEVTYVFPDGRRMAGNTITDWKKIPGGTRVCDSGSISENESERVLAIGTDGDSAADIAGAEVALDTTFYFLPDRIVGTGKDFTQGQLDAMPRGTRMLVGYVCGGQITVSRSAFDICGERWHGIDTFYRFPDGSIQAGDKVNEKTIPAGTLLYFRN